MAEEKNENSPEIGVRVGRADMPFLAHVEELRWRLIKSIIAVAVMTIIALIFSDRLYKWVTWPLGDIKLHFTEITGSFVAYLKIAFYMGIIAATPVISYQLWQFVAPGLYRKEKRVFMPIVTISTVLFLAGASFCFFVVLPYALQFLIGFSGGEMIPIVTVSSYISFAGMMLLAFGLTFEMPVIGYLLGRLGIISARLLSKGRTYAVVIILVVAAFLTPTPDVFNQLLLAVPMYLLYEVTIIVVRMTSKEKQGGP